MPAPGDSRRWTRLLAAAGDEVAHILRSLPAPVRDKAQPLPVCFEPKPSASCVRDGLDPDLLGLFMGESFAESMTGSGDVLPSQITLYLENIWAYADGDARTYRLEVRRTYLHELGHYLGLDEQDLIDRDLD